MFVMSMNNMLRNEAEHELLSSMKDYKPAVLPSIYASTAL